MGCPALLSYTVGILGEKHEESAHYREAPISHRSDDGVVKPKSGW
jgi:hypothetical protein